jgi:HEAT repeats
VLHPLLLVPVVILALASPTQAGLFRKTVKPDPATHVPALIETLKSSKDEKARAAAATELREYDAKVFPDILPALTEALTNDPRSSVRADAAESIGKVRPISLQAGYALEQAIAHDKDTIVRISARWAIAQYRVLGYFAGGKTDLTTVQTAEPPLASSSPTKVTAGGTILRPTPPPVPVSGPVMPPSGPSLPPNSESLAPKVNPQTGEPPLEEPGRAAPILTTRPRTPTPIIVIPPPPREIIIPIPTVVPTPPALVGPKTLPDLGKPVEEGPTLGPPPPKG